MRNHLRACGVLATLTLVTCVKTAAGGEYRDPTGFSFVYSEGWFAVTNLQAVTKESSFPSGIRNWLKNNRVDFSKVRALVVRDGHDEFLENLNVVVIERQKTVTDTALKQHLKLLPQQYASMGVKIEDLHGRIQKLGTNQAMVVDYRFIFPGSGEELRQRQANIPGGGKTYIVTCTWKADTSADCPQALQNILASFKVPSPIAQQLDSTRVFALAGTVLGTLFGGLISFFVGMVLLKIVKGPRTKRA
jgi:hypothetical protein